MPAAGMAVCALGWPRFTEVCKQLHEQQAKQAEETFGSAALETPGLQRKHCLAHPVPAELLQLQ